MSQSAGPVHWSFWAVAAATLIWNVMGSINFVVQLDPEAIASYRESERAIIEGRPLWATAGFALAVFGGAVGSILLLLRKPLALYLFVASFLGVLVTMIHTAGVGMSKVDFSGAEIAGVIVMPLAVAVFLVWYAKFAERKGWVV